MLYKLVTRIVTLLLNLGSKLDKILKEQDAISFGQRLILKVELKSQHEQQRQGEVLSAIQSTLSAIQATQAEQSATLQKILEQVSPPIPGEAVTLEFVFGGVVPEVKT